jgi:hypothetical protein
LLQGEQQRFLDRLAFDGGASAKVLAGHARSLARLAGAA